MAKQFNIEKPSDWQNVTVSELKFAGGVQFLRQYASFYDALRANYPEYSWDVFDSRKNVPRNYWKNEDNCREFLERLVEIYHIKTAEDFAKIQKDEIHKIGGSGLLHNSTLVKLVKKYYPHWGWKGLNEIKRTPPGFWEQEENVFNFMKNFETKNAIKHPLDWLRISQKQVTSAGGSGLVKKYRNIRNILKVMYPDVAWEQLKIGGRDKRSVQRILFTFLQAIFMEEELIEEFIHADLTRTLGHSVEFDIFIPKYNLAFEYHGEHHYKDLPSFGSLELYQMRDQEKQNLCKEFKIRLVVIPYWWDGSFYSLQGTVAYELYDIFPNLISQPHPAPIPSIDEKES